MRRLAPLVVLPVSLSACGQKFDRKGGDADSDTGTLTDSGTDTGACAGGATLQIEVTSESDLPYCVRGVGAGFCDPGWVSLVDAAETPVPIFGPCLPDCASCSEPVCPDPECPSVRRIAEGETEILDWDGTTVVDSTCGVDVPCLDRRCLGPGRYSARFCASEDLQLSFDCTYLSTPTCVDVEFDLPAKELVVGLVAGR